MGVLVAIGIVLVVLWLLGLLFFKVWASPSTSC